MEEAGSRADNTLYTLVCIFDHIDLHKNSLQYIEEHTTRLPGVLTLTASKDALLPHKACSIDHAFRSIHVRK